MRVRYNCASHQREIPGSKCSSRKNPSITSATGCIPRARFRRQTRARCFAPRKFSDARPIFRAKEFLTRSASDFQDFAEGSAFAQLRRSSASGASALVRLRALSRSIIESIGASPAKYETPHEGEPLSGISCLRFRRVKETRFIGLRGRRRARRAGTERPSFRTVAVLAKL